jgi:spore germination cell wall hydrolase CwlJ-like protein
MRGILLSIFLLVTSTVYAGSEYQEKQNNLQQLIDTNKSSIDKQRYCLAETIYFEAADYKKSQLAVANVVINRVIDSDYPKTVCAVTHQTTKTRSGKHVCQFSYQCEGDKDINTESDKWASAQEIAASIMHAFVIQQRTDITHGATHFHDERVTPSWAESPSFVEVLKTKHLTFYKERD